MVTIDYFKGYRVVDWKWPVEIVLGIPDEKLREQMHQREWVRNLSNIHLKEFYERSFLKIGIGWNSPNILILLDETGTAMDDYSTRSNAVYDVIIILSSQEVAEDFKNKKDKVQKFARKTRTAGVFVLDPGPDIPYWFVEVIRELSHNKDIITVLKDLTLHGYFLVDRILEVSTKLDFVVRRLIDELYLTPGNWRFDSKLEGKSFFTSAEVAVYLEKNASTFPFELEEQAATEIAGIANAFRDAMGYGNDPRGKMDNLAPPPPPPSMEVEVGAFEATSEAVGEMDEDTRRLQGQIKNEITGDRVQHLFPETNYSLEIKVGSDSTWTSAKEGFPTSVVFEDVRSSEEMLQIVFRAGQEGEPSVRDMVLPRVGESTVVNFSFNSGAQKEFTGEIYAYHKNRLIQKAIVHAAVQQADKDVLSFPAFSIRVVFSAVKAMANISSRKEFGASFFYEPRNSPGEILGFGNNKPIDLYLLSDGLEKIIGKIKQNLEDAIVDIEKHPPDLMHAANVKVLRNLALKGNTLLVNHLGKKNNFPGPVQIVTKRVGFIPIDFIYELPAPAEDATLCTHAVEALKNGACRKCYDHTVSPAPHICPFGFWTFSRVIERHSAEYRTPTGTNPGDYQVVAASDTSTRTLSILNQTVHASSTRMEEAQPGLCSTVSNYVKSNSIQFNAADTWEKWKTFTDNKKPDSLILITHVEYDDDQEADKLEIGKNSTLIQNFLDETTVGKAPPFVIIIGCEVTDTKNFGFDISNQLMRHGAAIVLSNFTKIRGRHAAVLVMKLIELLQRGKEHQLTLGEVLLKLKQQMLAAGIMASLSLMAHGDADWKIRVAP